ncbi:MAG: hypothetical protein IKL68_05795 [Clostridia bacterium]|nr:hypothetical protein [Clostridia bacterium]
MKKESFLDYIIKNRWVIICLAIVLVLVFTGVVKVLVEVLVTVALIIGAIYIGKRIQEDNDYITRAFKRRKEEIKYTVKDDDEE